MHLVMSERQGVATSAVTGGLSRQSSEHHLAKSVVHEADRILNGRCHASTATVTMLTDAEEFRAIPGKGLEAVVRGCTVRIGSMTAQRWCRVWCTWEGRSATTARAI